MTQFVAEEIKNTRILKTSIYDLADGSIQVYVCLEIRTNKNDFEKNLNNTLDRERHHRIAVRSRSFREEDGRRA